MIRIEDDRFLRGAGRYTADLDFPDCLHACLLRSPHAHARIVSIDTKSARDAPGVVAVFTSADLEAHAIGSLACERPVKNRDGTSLHAPPWRLLALETVRHVGDPVAMVVAETEEAAKDGSELIEVEYEELTAAVTLPKGESRCLDWEIGDQAAVDAAFSSAAATVSIEMVNNRIVVNPLEPRAAIGAYDVESQRYTLYLPSQGVHFIRRLLAEPVLGIPEEKLRVVTYDVGGGFGMKFVAFPEQGLVLFAAKQLNRPVRWIGTRAEAFVADTHGRDQLGQAELALDERGQFLALRVSCAANLGAYLSAYGVGIVTTSFTKMAGSVYRIPAIHVRVKGLLTNTAPTEAYRGAGTPEMVYLMERLIERAARQLGVDRLELRRRNLVTSSELPYTTPLGRKYEDGDFPAVFEEALNQSQWRTFDARREAANQQGKLRGIGLAPYVKVTNADPGECAMVSLTSDGQIEVRIGTQDSGQGHASSFAQLVAELLGIDVGHITVIQGDSDLLPSGSGTGGSSSLIVDAETISTASDRFIERARSIAADVLEAATADIECEAGRLLIVGTDRGIGLLELAAHLPKGPAGGCVGNAAFDGDSASYPNGTHVCEVEIDPETGATQILRFTAVDDIGRVWHPPIAEGQVHGGVVQGIGQALYEHTVYEPSSGQLLSGSFMDYCLPRADDLPEIDAHWKPTPAANKLGVKGIGEQGPVGAPPAVMNAIADALGDHTIQMPATPERIWQAINSGRRLTQQETTDDEDRTPSP